MFVRTGDNHGFQEHEAIIDQFSVVAIPTRDFAAMALRKAQDAYFKQWPDERRRANELLWDIVREIP